MMPVGLQPAYINILITVHSVCWITCIRVCVCESVSVSVLHVQQACVPLTDEDVHSHFHKYQV